MTNKDQTPIIGIQRSQPSEDEIVQLLDVMRGELDEHKREQAVIRLGELQDNRAVQVLRGRLDHDKSARVRFFAAQALFQIGDPKVDQALVSALTDQDPSVREKAAELLGLLGDQAKATDLLPSLKDNNGCVIDQAAISIGRLRNPAIIKDLIAGLPPHHDSQFNKGCIKALIAMGSMIVESLLTSIDVRFLSENYKSYFLDLYIERLTISMGGKELLADSGGYIWDEGTKNYQMKVTEAEPWKTPDNRNSAEWISIDQMRFGDYLCNFRHTGLSQYYDTRIQILVGIGKPAIESMVKHLEKSSSNPVIRIIIIRALGEIPDLQSLNILSQIAKTDSQHIFRWFAVKGLQNQNEIQGSDVIASLEWVLQNDPEDRIRAKAAEVLGNLESSSSVNLLCGIIKTDPAYKVRNMAIASLSKIKSQDAIPTLGDILLDFPDVNSRGLSVEAMERIGSKEAIPYLLSALHTELSYHVRRAIIRVFKKLKDPQIVGILRNLITDDPDPEIRIVAQSVLNALLPTPPPNI